VGRGFVASAIIGVIETLPIRKPAKTLTDTAL
jgi:hypothetical protein